MRAHTRPLAAVHNGDLDLNDVARGDGYLFVRDGVGVAGRGVAARVPLADVAATLAALEHIDEVGGVHPIALGVVPFEAGLPCGPEANMAKLLAADASWQAADMCLQTHGGYGFTEEFDVERKFRETRLYQVAPISTNLILSYIGEHVLGLPRSY